MEFSEELFTPKHKEIHGQLSKISFIQLRRHRGKHQMQINSSATLMLFGTLVDKKIKNKLNFQGTLNMCSSCWKVQFPNK